MADDNERKIGELQDAVKHRDRHIQDLKREIDESRDLVRRLEENVEDCDNVLESWRDTFQMVQTDDGWSWKPFWNEHNALIDKHNELVNRWNRFVPLLNNRRVGRPLAASEAQVAEVLKLHKAGMSIRDIADETGLGRNTVFTIVGRKAGTDRTTKRHRARIEPDRAQTARWKSQRRTGNALPKRAQRVVEQGRALRKEAKGLAKS
jgi:hypothetical protein